VSVPTSSVWWRRIDRPGGYGLRSSGEGGRVGRHTGPRSATRLTRSGERSLLSGALPPAPGRDRSRGHVGTSGGCPRVLRPLASPPAFPIQGGALHPRRPPATRSLHRRPLRKLVLPGEVRMSRTVMMIHGAWLTPASFDRFRERYEARGFACLAPPWPYMDRPIDQLRKDPDPRLARVTIGEIVDHYAAIVNTLPEPPILMGHSFGGLFVQLLLDRRLGAAGVAIDPGTPRGVLPGMDTMLSSMPVLLAWNGWNRVLTMQFETFASRFAQRLSPAEMRAAYDQYIVPAPGRLYWQAAAGMGNALNYANP